MNRLGYLDGWRGIAILCVIASHFGPALLEDLGSLGVELFFVLSGRLMVLMLLERKTEYSTFFIRRASRILPALWAYVLCAMAFHVMAGYGLFSLRQLFSVLTFTLNYDAIDGNTPLLLLQIWSLCIEEWAYLVLACICVVGARDVRKAGVLALAVSVFAMLNGLRLYIEGAGGVLEIYWRTDVRIASVTTSFAICSLWNSKVFWIPLMLGVVFLLAPIPLKFTVGTLCLSLAVNAIDHARYRALFETKWLCWIGLISYSLYLWQHPFYRLNVGAIGVPLAFALAYVSYSRLENPARDAINRLWNKRIIATKASTS